MYPYALFSIAIISQVLSLSLPRAVLEPVYVVPIEQIADVEEIEETEPTTCTVEQNIPCVKDGVTWELRPLVQAARNEPHMKTAHAGPDTNAAAAIVIDEVTQKILWAKNPDTVLPIASITKLMTAMVWFDNQPTNGLEHIHAIAPEQDTPEGKELDLPYGSELSADDLLHVALIASDNDAALGLAQTTSIAPQRYVELMNEKAVQLGLEHTSFSDATGLSARNTASVSDIARMARAAFTNTHIQDAAGLPDYAFETRNDQQRHRVYTTNQLLASDAVEIVAAKTGYIPEAGYCFVARVRVPGSERDMIVAVLGTPTQSARFDEAKKIIDWALEYYAWN